MNNLLKEFGEVFGFSEKDLKGFLDNNKPTIKITENGKTIVDIEKGVNKLEDSKLPECKGECKKKYVKPEVKTVNTPVFTSTDPVTEEPSDVKHIDGDKPLWLTDDILLITDDSFVAVNKVNDLPLDRLNTEINFTHKSTNGWVPGLTEQQLIGILLFRYRNNPEKFNTLKRLLY